MTDPTPTVPRTLLRVHEAATALAISEAMTWRYVTSGRLRSIKIGAARRVPVDALDEFVRAQETTEAEIPGGAR